MWARLQGQNALDGLSVPLEQLLVLQVLVRRLIRLHLDVLAAHHLQAVHILQHVGAHNGLVVHTGTAHVGVHRRAMAMPMSVAGDRTYGRRGSFAVRWLLALHVRLMQQGELAAAVALQLPAGILEAAVEDAAALAPWQTLFPTQRRIRGRAASSSSRSKSRNRSRSRNKISRRERSESRERLVSEISGRRQPEQQSSKPKTKTAKCD